MSSAASVVTSLRSCRIAAFPLMLLAVAAATPSLALAQCSGAGTTTYSSSGGVSVVEGTISTSTNSISVSVPAGNTITCVSLILNGVTTNGSTDASMDYASFMLTAPSGQKFEFLGSTGDGTDGDDFNDAGSGLAGVNITVWDGASTAAPAYGTAIWPHTGSVTVKPGSYYLLPANNSGKTPPLPVGGSASQWAASDGSDTFTKAFVTSGATPSGNWTLSLTDNNTFNHNGDPVSVTSWSLVMTTVASANASTTTSLSSSNTSSFTSGTSSAVTLTATVSSTGTVSGGTVAFTDGGNAITCSGGNQVVSNGSATCVTTFTTEGIHALTATYSGATGFNGSSGSANQFVKNHSTLTSGYYCNSGAITEAASTVTPYPSVVNVGTDTTALSGSVANVTVKLTGLSDTTGLGPGYAFLLVAPDSSKAYNLDFLANAGSSSSQPSATIYLADDNTSVPVNGAISSGTYQATNYASSAPSWIAATTPAPALPGTINYAQPDYFGSSPTTFNQAFDGANGSGDWKLYAWNLTGSTMHVTGGWCLAFTVNSGHATTTTVTSSANPVAVKGSSVTFTATITSSPTPNEGTVTFTENGSPLVGAPNSGLANVSNGVASISTSSLPEGDHTIVATYNDSTGTYNESTGSISVRIETTTTVTGMGTIASPAVYCNPGGITLPAGSGTLGNIGAASPNPSNISVANLPGTINTMSVTLQGLHTSTVPQISDTAALLVGPRGTSAQSFDFFSGTGASNTQLSTGNYVFADSASGLVPQSAYSAGTYKPTDYDSSDTFFASPFYILPSSFVSAAPHGSGTFASVFGNAVPTGTWSLYFNQNTHEDNAGLTGWCLNFVQNLPTVTVTKYHTGNFAQGQQNAAFGISVLDTASGPTGDPTGSNPLTLTDVLAAGFSYAGYSGGGGWSCSASGQTVTCTNDFSVAGSSSYSTLTLNVNVAANAAASLSNSVTVSGAGVSSTTSNTDTVTIKPAPVLYVIKSHTGTFTQGQIAQWDITVGNTTPGSTTNGAVNVSDTLPTGYTVYSFGTTPAAWVCSGTGTQTATCSNTSAVAGSSAFPAIQVYVNVPGNSPTSVSNTAYAWGGGDLNHTSLGTAASAGDYSVPVIVPASKLVFTNAPSSPITAGVGGNTVTIAEETSAGATVTTDTDTITLTVTGPNGYSQQYQSAAVSGVASFNLTSVALTNAGAYTYTATFSPLAQAQTTQTVTAAATSAFSVTGLGIFTAPGASGTVTVTAVDAFGNTTTTFAGTTTFSSSDSLAVLPANYTYVPGDNGTHNFNVTFNTAGLQSITATSSSITGTETGILVEDAIWLINKTGTLARLNDNGGQLTTAGSSGTAGTVGAVAFDHSGNVWATDSANSSVLKFDHTGSSIAVAGSSAAGVSAPQSLAIDGLGYVWIANGNNTVSVLNSSGAAVTSSTGYRGGNMNSPTGIIIDSSGSVWLTNSGNNTVTKIIGGAAPVVTPTVTGTSNNQLGTQP